MQNPSSMEQHQTTDNNGSIMKITQFFSNDRLAVAMAIVKSKPSDLTMEGKYLPNDQSYIPLTSRVLC
jgi:hypothetical protein